jgi:DNA-binding PadR family transcriptional regulator
VRLSTTSYVVLGLVESCQPATPYDIKRMAEMSTSHFWTVAHTQLYSECSRLAREGLLDERQEQTGRRRKLYRITDAGREALDGWRAEPAGEQLELRDPGMLKLFFGADPRPLAEAQLTIHEKRLAEYRELVKVEMPDGMRLALECGLGHEREYVRYWKKVLDGATETAPTGARAGRDGAPGGM